MAQGSNDPFSADQKGYQRTEKRQKIASFLEPTLSLREWKTSSKFFIRGWVLDRNCFAPRCLVLL